MAKILKKKKSVGNALQDLVKSHPCDLNGSPALGQKPASTKKTAKLKSAIVDMKETSASTTRKASALGKKGTAHPVNSSSKYDASLTPASIILSGVESDKYWNIVVDQGQMKTVLMSYHYLKGKPKNFLKERIKKYPDVRVFIDSGAYTFIVKQDDYMDKGQEFWDKYLTDYTDWVRDNAECVFACANLDIEKIVGQDTVDEWNDKYFEPLKEHGVDTCYIWHKDRGTDGWEQYCKEHDYVGLSTENDSLTLQQITKMVNVARRHGARVHGMAVTKTDLLVRVPLFSADSTTWIVGQQYGELNWFNGRGMQRLSKHDWRTTYKTRLLKEPFNADWDLLINGMGGRGDTYELLRLNVIAFKLAEEYIRKRLRTKMYWLKENKKDEPVETKDSLDDVEIPDLEWFEEGEQENYKHYLKELHLSIDTPKEEAVDLIYSFYLYLKDDGTKLDTIKTNDLLDYCKNILEKEVSTRDEAIENIRQFYLDNALGNRKDFLDEISEEEQNRPKERVNYIEDEEFETVDMSPELIMGLLPPPTSGNSMPEVEEYDAELQRSGITVVRDDKGRFVKGQQRVRKAKNIYSDKYPKLACDTCYKAGDCQEYRAGYVCAFNKAFKKFNTRNLEDVQDAMHSIASSNLERLQRAMMFETMDGGMATPEVSNLIDQSVKLLSLVKEMGTPKALVQQRRTVREDGTEETVTQLNMSNPSQGGILSKIFGAPPSAPSVDRSDPADVVVEADYEVD